MTDKEKVVKSLETCSDVYYGATGACSSCSFSQSKNCFAELVYQTIELLKEQEEQLSIKTENFNRLVAKVEVMPKIVRCKDCIHRGKSEKCVLAAISEEKDYPLFMLDDRGEWFCADGERRNVRVL